MIYEKVLSKISGPTKTTVTFGWREFCNKEFVIFTGSYCGVQDKEDEIGEACSMHWKLHTYEVLLSAQEDLRCLGLFSKMISLLIS